MKKWVVNKPDKKTISELTFKCSVTTLTAAVLASKGYSTAKSVVNSLNVSSLSDPFLIKDMQIAADTINDAIDNQCKICVYGDYDCDGIMATVMLYSYLVEIGADVIYYIPERSEGYGLNMDSIKSLSNKGVELIITVDNGISALDESEFIYQSGMRLVVTDHHQPGETLPHAEAIVDPHRNDCFSPFKFLCGAGVVLKLIAALDDGDYTMALEQFGDFAAIATVADIVSLTGENRFIASYGLQLIENTDRQSLAALKNVCGLTDKKIDSFAVGFGLAPRINASGRFGSPKTAARLFLSDDEQQTQQLATELNNLNIQRKNTENEIMSEIYQMLNSNPLLANERVVFLCGKNWHHGVIGIVASKISEKLGKPCFIASDYNGEIRGSARSFGEFSIFGALTYCSDALEKFGGHPGAGGFTIKQNMISEFNLLLQKYALENHKIMPLLTLSADAVISPTELTIENIKGLELLEPFGAGNEKPHFYIENAIVSDIVPLSNGAHTKLKLKIGFTDVEALVFKTPPSLLCIAKGDSCDMIVSLGINEFKGTERINIIVDDYRRHDFEQSKIFSAVSAFESFLRNEKLPDNYYGNMYPIRDEVKEIYIRIPINGIPVDLLYSKLSRINYCKFRVALQALIQLGLISHSFSDNMVFRQTVNKKVDLLSAPILIDLNDKINMNNRQTVSAK